MILSRLLFLTLKLSLLKKERNKKDFKRFSKHGAYKFNLLYQLIVMNDLSNIVKMQHLLPRHIKPCKHYAWNLLTKRIFIILLKTGKCKKNGISNIRWLKLCNMLFVIHINKLCKLKNKKKQHLR